MATRSITTPDLFDGRGLVPHGALMKAHRCDIHAYVDEQRLDENGQATFTNTIPTETDTVYHTMWGGVTGYGKYQWFPIRFMEIEDGGTGASTAADALDNLGVHAAAILWALVL